MDQAHIERAALTLGAYTFIIATRTTAGSQGSRVVEIYHQGQALLSRTFYFDAAARHLHAFARKFADDPTYRQDCLSGRARWARRDRWFESNARLYAGLLQTVRGPLTPYEQRLARRQRERSAQELRRLYQHLDKHLEVLEASQAYLEHLQREPPARSPADHADEELAQAVQSLNRIRGVSVAEYCQGISQGLAVDWWPHGPIWFPSIHRERAYLRFAKLQTDVAHHLEQALRRAGVGRQAGGSLISHRPETNTAFIALLKEVLGEGWF